MMFRRFAIILTATTALSACNNMAGDVMETDATALLNSMEGPEISGVDATMLKMAQSAETRGDYRSAAQTYQQLMDKNPTNVTLGISYAEALRRSGKADNALEIYNKILKVEPKNQDALEGKGLSELSIPDLDAASKTLTTLAEMNPNRWRTLNAIGILFATRGLYDESLQYFDTALQKKPNHPAIINNKGLVLALDLQFPAAISNLLDVSEISKSPMYKTQADLNAALVYAIAGDLPNAETMASKHLDGASLQNNLGLYALLAKDDALARTHLHMALSESKVFYEKAWDNLNNIQSGKRAASKGADKSKRIQLSNTQQSGIKALPGLPQPGSTSSSRSGVNPHLFENPEPAANFTTATPEPEKAVVPDTTAQEPVVEKIDAAAESTTAPAAEPAPVVSEENNDSKSNINIASKPADETKEQPADDTGGTGLPSLNLDFFSRFNAAGQADAADAKVAEPSSGGSNVNINTGDTAEVGASTSSSTEVEAPENDEAANTKNDGDANASESAPPVDSKEDSNVGKPNPYEDFKKLNAEKKASPSKTDTATESETKDHDTSANGDAEDTPGEVSDEKTTFDNIEKESAVKSTPDAEKNRAPHQNGFESLEDYIKNW